MTPSVQKVATKWWDKYARDLRSARLQKKTPTQMAVDDLNLPVPDARFDRAMSMLAQYLGGRFDRGNSVIILPWKSHNKSFPTKLTVLYRKFPCGFLHKTFNGESRRPCVSFDLIPNTPNPQKSRAYRSFNGPIKDSKKLFNEFLLWTKVVADSLKAYAARHNVEEQRKTQFMVTRGASSLTEVDMSDLTSRVAARFMTKQAFNKENPSDLLSQLVKLLDKASKEAEGNGKKGLVDASSRVKGLAKPVQKAWEHRNDE